MLNVQCAQNGKEGRKDEKMGPTSTTGHGWSSAMVFLVAHENVDIYSKPEERKRILGGIKGKSL